MAYRPPVGVGTVLPRTGPSFARARLVLAKRAGYLPPNYAINSGVGAQNQWRDASKDLAARARGAGFTNPLQWLRQGAAAGKLPSTLTDRPIVQAPLPVVPTNLAPPPIAPPVMRPSVMNTDLGKMFSPLTAQSGKTDADPRILALLHAMSGRR